MDRMRGTGRAGADSRACRSSPFLLVAVGVGLIASSLACNERANDHAGGDRSPAQERATLQRQQRERISHRC